MGGFLYWDKQQIVDHAACLPRSLEVFAKKRLSDGRLLAIKEVIERDKFVIYLYEKIGVQTENLLHLDDGDFIFNSGTLIYRGQTGSAALKKIHADFDPDSFKFDDLQGQFCIFLYKNGKRFIWNDLFGIYHVFTNDNHSLISSSFLAVVRQMKTRQLNPQGLYEYVCEGACYADDTYINGVKLLNANYICRPGSPGAEIRKKHAIDADEEIGPDRRVEQMVESLKSYFASLKHCFGGSVCSALSGGYDSRLILALISEVGMNPFLYVYGSKQSADVRIASAIAAAEKIDLHHDDRQQPGQTLEAFRELLEAEFYYCDGHGPNGAFTNGAEYQARTLRTNAASLQLNGGGGEIFRNFWKQPDRPVTIDAFVQSRFDYLPASSFTASFDPAGYLSNLHRKIQVMLEISSERLTRNELDKLYVYMRIKYWMGYNTSLQNVRSYALIPLTEPVFVFPSFSIPFESRNSGTFEAALIRRLNPRLAAYPSAYGYDFSDNPPLGARLKNSLELNLPVSAKRLLRKIRYTSASRKMPYFLQEEFIDSVIPAGSALTDEYFNADSFRDPFMSSRLQTVNLVLSDPF